MAPDGRDRRIKRYKVSLHVDQVIDAEHEEEALGIFWDDLHDAVAYEELADIEEVR